MSLRQRYKTNKQAEQTGVRHVVDINPDGTEAAIFIARAGGGNIRFLSVLNEKTKSHTRNGVIVGLSAEQQRAILKQVYAETVVTGWEHVYDDGPDGESVPFPYSKQNALQLLTDPDMDDLFNEIVQVATNAELFRAARLEAEAKN